MDRTDRANANTEHNRFKDSGRAAETRANTGFAIKSLIHKRDREPHNKPTTGPEGAAQVTRRPTTDKHSRRSEGSEGAGRRPDPLYALSSNRGQSDLATHAKPPTSRALAITSREARSHLCTAVHVLGGQYTSANRSRYRQSPAAKPDLT